LLLPFAAILRVAAPKIKSQLKIATITKSDTPRTSLPWAERRMPLRRRPPFKRSLSEQDA